MATDIVLFPISLSLSLFPSPLSHLLPPFPSLLTLPSSPSSLALPPPSLSRSSPSLPLSHPVVYHHGRTAQGGHYTCDVYNPSSGGWLRMDDNFVKPIPDEAVLKQSSVPKVAYLLFYRRMDTILEHRKKD